MGIMKIALLMMVSMTVCLSADCGCKKRKKFQDNDDSKKTEHSTSKF
jgi:hypothetical protein